MKRSLLAGLLALSIFGVANVHAKGKEEYKVINPYAYQVQAELDEYAKDGWKVRAITTAASVTQDPNAPNYFILVILYREVQ